MTTTNSGEAFELVLEGVRCFRRRQDAPVRPLTLLVGENRSGETSFLAMLSMVLNRDSFPCQPRFDEAPYFLGGFDSMGSAPRNGNGTKQKFTIGFRHAPSDGSLAREVLADYANEDNNPVLEALRVRVGTSRLKLRFAGNRMVGSLGYHRRKTHHVIPLNCRLEAQWRYSRLQFTLWAALSAFGANTNLKAARGQRFRKAANQLANAVTPSCPLAVS
jgi:hypothetical protein